MSPSLNKSRLTVEGSASMTAHHYSIESPGMQDGLAGVGSNAAIPLIGRYASDGTAHFGPSIPAQTIDETRIVASGEGCTDIRSTVVGRDGGADFLDQILRVQFITRLSLYRFKLPLGNKLSPNPTRWLASEPGTLTNANVFLERQDPPPVPPGFIQVLDEQGNMTVTKLIRAIFLGPNPQNDFATPRVQWGISGDYPITRDMVLRGRIVDIMQQLAEPFSHCEAERPVTLPYLVTDLGARPEVKLYIGPLNLFPAGQSISIDYAKAKISHWEYREYRGPKYGLVTLIGAIDKSTLGEFDLSPEESDTVSYDQHGHVIQQVHTTVRHRAVDNAVVQITRVVSGPDEDTEDSPTGTPPDGSGDIVPLNIRVVQVENIYCNWEQPLIEPTSGQIVNRPVELVRLKITDDGEGHQTSSELTINSYDEYKRLAASLTVTTETDPDTNEITYQQSEAKTYPRASMIDDYMRLAMGDIEALTHIPGGAGSMPSRGHPFVLSRTIDDTPGAVDVTINNEFLDGPLLEVIFSQLQQSSGKKKKQFIFRTGAMPWVRVGDRVSIRNVVDTDGNPFPMPGNMVVADVHQMVDFSDEHPEEVQEITLQQWEL